MGPKLPTHNFISYGKGIVGCKNCGWQGKLFELVHRYGNNFVACIEICGFEEHYCPKCHVMLDGALFD